MSPQVVAVPGDRTGPACRGCRRGRLPWSPPRSAVLVAFAVRCWWVCRRGPSAPTRWRSRALPPDPASAGPPTCDSPLRAHVAPRSRRSPPGVSEARLTARPASLAMSAPANRQSADRRLTSSVAMPSWRPPACWEVRSSGTPTSRGPRGQPRNRSGGRRGLPLPLGAGPARPRPRGRLAGRGGRLRRRHPRGARARRPPRPAPLDGLTHEQAPGHNGPCGVLRAGP